MGVKMVVSEVSAEIAGMNAELERASQAVECLLHRLQNYANDTDLEGEAYSNHKIYISVVHIPVAKGFMEVCKRMQAANNKYIEIVRGCFPTVDKIDEDFWSEQYKKTDAFYIALNNMDELKKSVSEKNINYCYQLERLYNLVKLYKKYLDNLRDMIGKLKDIYWDTEYLKAALADAINQLNVIQMTEDGYYMIADISAFQYLMETVDNLEISDVVITALGEDYIDAEEFMSLTEQEQVKYLAHINDIVVKILPKLNSQAGYIEIPLSTNLTFYLETTISTAGGDAPLNCELEIEKNGELLSNNVVSAGDISFEQEEMQWGIIVEKDVDLYSTAYIETEYNARSNVMSIEYGVTTMVGEVEHGTTDFYRKDGEVTTACGVRIDNSDIDWTLEPEASYVTVEPAEPILTVEQWREQYGHIDTTGGETFFILMGVLLLFLEPELIPVLVPAL